MCGSAFAFVCSFIHRTDCPQDFYASSKARDLLDKVRSMGAAEILEQKAVLIPIAVEIWHEHCVHLRNDAIDFFLL